MREDLELLGAIDRARGAGRRVALATVVRVRGSAYRREGTKMMIDETGAQACVISGGCLEAEVGELAQQVLASGEPVLKAFDLDEEVAWGLGLGCGGSVDVYTEALDEGAAFGRWLDAVRRDEAAALVTVLGTKARLFVGAQGERVGGLGDTALERALGDLAEEKMSERFPRPETRTFASSEGPLEVFLDLRVPAPRLFIFGAGHDAVPLSRYAQDLGFAVTVIDARPAFVTEARFPGAALIRTHPAGFAEALRLDARSYVLVMNHHLERDRESLSFALSSPAPYVGVLGPRQRYERMLARLAEDGDLPDAQALSRVHSPVGVDVGAETPEEIAMSVLTELLALRRGYRAGFLREREGPIHTDRLGR